MNNTRIDGEHGDDAAEGEVPDVPAAPRRFHVVVGAGVVGSGVATRLADAGHDVRIVTRAGSGPEHGRIERVAADGSDARRLTELAVGAHAIFNCANPSYSTWASVWPPFQAALIAAAEATGARLVAMGNLYASGSDSSPMAATDPLDPPTTKGAIRAAMWRDAIEADRAGRIRTTEVRASDFFGPRLGASAHLGSRFVPRLLASTSVSMVGRTDQAHSWTYIEDVCDAVAALGNDDRALGRAWHVPTVAPMTATQMADAICDAAGVERQKVRRIPRLALRAAGLFSADLRAVVEMLYQFDRPFVIDATDTTDVFGLRATPLDAQIAATVASYRKALTDGTVPSAATSAADPSPAEV
ncbi:MAG: NAD-dependent epimerase/dehydratase family protein [Ilumatobacter sp.]|uniref:NAD-dependent epimerase/dehydratase family protein n=1 Tax=Ilumatobacter sp. TaxID=1967498 RepID=UPI003298BF99